MLNKSILKTIFLAFIIISLCGCNNEEYKKQQIKIEQQIQQMEKKLKQLEGCTVSKIIYQDECIQIFFSNREQLKIESYAHHSAGAHLTIDGIRCRRPK